jgi:hypothetical protein
MNKPAVTESPQGRKSQEKGDKNRALVFLQIVMKPRTFSELHRDLKESKELRSTKSLANHLKGLEKDGIIELAILNRKPVYRIKTHDTNKIVAELERDLFHFSLSVVLGELISLLYPDFHKDVEKSLRELALSVVKKAKETSKEARKERTEKSKEIQEATIIKEAKSDEN